MTKTSRDDDDSSSSATAAAVITISPKELKELRRVYDKLCYFSEKILIREKLKPIEDRLGVLERPEIFHDNNATRGVIATGAASSLASSSAPPSSSSPSPSGTDTNNNNNNNNNASSSPKNSSSPSSSPRAQVPDPIKHEIKSLHTTRKKLKKELHAITHRPDQHIRPQDAAAAMKFLGKRVTKRQCLDMIWEVDEKLDNVVDWDEFRLMFERNVRDTTGLEPASFYHMVQFMIYDRDDNGMVSIDETMNMLYARLGREKMESTISKLFGGDDGAPIKEVGSQGGEIDFMRYWEVVEKEQAKMFSESELGKTLAEKKKKKKKIDLNKGKKT